MDLSELTGLTSEIALGKLIERASEPFEKLSGEAGAEGIAGGFWRDRVRFALEQRGTAIDVVRGATAGENVVPLRARRVAEALQRIRTSEDLQALAVLFKRVKNIARELKTDRELDRSALTEPAEQALLAELDARRPKVTHAAQKADYRQAFTEIAALRPVVDRFFTEVFVMADDERLRTARLRLMADLRDLILELADISEIVPQTE